MHHAGCSPPSAYSAAARARKLCASGVLKAELADAAHAVRSARSGGIRSARPRSPAGACGSIVTPAHMYCLFSNRLTSSSVIQPFLMTRRRQTRIPNRPSVMSAAKIGTKFAHSRNV